MNIDDKFSDDIDISGFDLDDRDEYDALIEMSNYNFSGSNEVGHSLVRYNGAQRVDIRKLEKVSLIKSPLRFMTVVKQLSRDASIIPSHGLLVNKGGRKDYVHLVLEIGESSSVGVFFYDTKRTLSVPQIHSVERAINECGLSGGVIIANKIGIPAKQEAARINADHGEFGIITIEHYDTIEKRFKGIL
ncbi:MAG: hypothetical protein OEZ01_13660 [Candidatus Heimdallarchaeota archaeon]|nr:hypothetical protein [Candidatus Heimdallarchaeota archaeon]MDH5647053.1 hypothetical protein [Candidatus Heimdallarchaeota archaeon]